MQKRWLALALVFIICAMARVSLASELFSQKNLGAATAYGFDAVLNNPAALSQLKGRLLGGGYEYFGTNRIVMGYLEPGFSDLYNPRLTNFRLAGGLTWLFIPEAKQNHFYYTIAFCTSPVYGGINLIYRKANPNSYGMDLAIGADWFENLTTALVVKDILTWSDNNNSLISNTSLVRLALTFRIIQPLAISFDAFTSPDKRTNFSFGLEYKRTSWCFRGGLGLDTTFKQFMPSLGVTYSGLKDKNRYSLDLGLAYKEGKIGHSAGFNYVF